MTVIPVDGQFLTLTAGLYADNLRLTEGRGGRSGGRRLFARVDLSDDRSFLSSRFCDLVDLAPSLSSHRRYGTGQGWIWIGLEQSACAIHVILDRLPVSVDLILGRCALELMTDAANAAATAPGAAEPANNIIDLKTARWARRALAD